MIKVILIVTLLLTLLSCSTFSGSGDNKWINCRVHAIKSENCQ